MVETSYPSILCYRLNAQSSLSPLLNLLSSPHSPLHLSISLSLGTKESPLTRETWQISQRGNVSEKNMIIKQVECSKLTAAYERREWGPEYKFSVHDNAKDWGQGPPGSYAYDWHDTSAIHNTYVDC